MISNSWVLTIVASSISCGVSMFLGWLLVSYLRSAVIRTDKSWKITLPIFITPVSVYFGLHLFVFFGLLDIILADAFSVGMVTGILVCLNSNPQGRHTVKLVAHHQCTEKSYDVWLNSTEVTVGEAREKIAEVLNVAPPSRVCIESGQGQFIQAMEAQLFPIINTHESATVMDFFGFVTASCYISVKDEERPTIQRTVSDNDHRIGDKSLTRRGSFMSNMLTLRSDVKYGDVFTLTARSRGVVSDTNIFLVQKVDKFVGAAPITMHQLFAGSVSGGHIRFVSWDALQTEMQLAETQSMTSGADTITTKPSEQGEGAPTETAKVSGYRKLAGDGAPIRNGDVVLLETDGMYASVTKGWWLAWNSPTPRRSGAFVVEIVERAQQQTLKEQVASKIMDIKEKIGRPSISLGAVGGIGGMETLGALGALSKTEGAMSTHTAASISSGPGNSSLPAGLGSITSTSATVDKTDNVLRPSDTFRLRSVKFPEFEIGVTIDRIRDGYCYIGLRKMEDTAASNSWCSSVAFSVKTNYLTNEMNKMQSAATEIINSTLRI